MVCTRYEVLIRRRWGDNMVMGTSKQYPKMVFWAKPQQKEIKICTTFYHVLHRRDRVKERDLE